MNPKKLQDGGGGVSGVEGGRTVAGAHAAEGRPLLTQNAEHQQEPRICQLAASRSHTPGRQVCSLLSMTALE